MTTTLTPQVRKASRTSPAVVITIGEQKIRSRSPRRYVVVAFRPEPTANRRWNGYTESYETDGILVPFIQIEKRTDSYKAAEAAVRKTGRAPGMSVVIVDTFDAR